MLITTLLFNGNKYIEGEYRYDKSNQLTEI